MKKLFAMLLALTMILSMTATAFAAEAATATVADKGAITVSGIKQEDGKTITVKAYQIVRADYEAEGNTFSGYTQLYTPAIQDLENPSVTEIYALKTSAMAGTPIELVLDTNNGFYKAEDVAPGMYLIVVEGSEAVTYTLAIASVRYVDENGL